MLADINWEYGGNFDINEMCSLNNYNVTIRWFIVAALDNYLFLIELLLY
jgi:hypothetical protein